MSSPCDQNLPRFEIIFNAGHKVEITGKNGVLYLPTKKKSFSPVIVLFTRMSCFIEYFPLLLRMGNDVEENSGPTVYVVEPTKTTCTDFRETAGKQCLAMSLAAIIHNDIINVNA